VENDLKQASNKDFVFTDMVNNLLNNYKDERKIIYLALRFIKITFAKVCSQLELTKRNN
jgi:sugar lactone lactonase YvrE